MKIKCGVVYGAQEAHNLLGWVRLPAPQPIMKVSVVIPVHNEEGTLPVLIPRLHGVLKKYDYEIIFIDDGSHDRSLIILTQEAKKNSRIRIISFTRNFGHQNALFCGYRTAQGDCVITIDADLQDPPELMQEMIETWKRGVQVVYAKRRSRQDTWFKRTTAHAFYRLLNALSDVPIPTDVGDYRLLDRAVVDYVVQLSEKHKFFRGLVAWGGFTQDALYFDRDARFAGTTHYTLSKMVNLALDGITSFSTKPLRIATYIGFFVSVLSLLAAFYAVGIRIFLPHDYWVTGWTTLIVAVLFMGGIQLITIGIFGEYLAKIYREVQNRPPYLIKQTWNV